MLSTEDVSVLLDVEGIRLSIDQVAELARNNVFPGASKQDGKWSIPAEDLTAFIQMRRKRSNLRKWITAGTIGLVITALSLLSITKDTLDLITDYVLPEPTPAVPICIVRINPPDCLTIRENPSNSSRLACLPDGTSIEVLGIAGQFYEISFAGLDRFFPDVNTEYQLVTYVAPDRPFGKAGVLSGDIIISYDDYRTSLIEQYTYKGYTGVTRYGEERKGRPVSLRILRGEEFIILDVIPTSQPGVYLGDTFGFNYVSLVGGEFEQGFGFVDAAYVSCPVQATPP